MTRETAMELNQLPAPERVSIDRICSEFERIWKSGAEPRLEDYCGDLSSQTSAVLLKELLYLEVHYRRQTGDEPRADDFRARFPDHATVIDDVWAISGELSVGVPAGSTRQALRDMTGGAPGRRSDTDDQSKFPEIPGYEIQDRLGHGGMAVVYRARDVRLNRLVALKIVAMTDPNAEVVSRLRTEAEAVARLQHPNIVEIHSVGEYEGRPYLALEYAANGNLAHWTGAIPQSPRRAAAIIETLARAVDFAHRQGIVHRDLKPTNVLLAGEVVERPAGESSDDEMPILKIADFGLAKFGAGESGHTHSGMLIGTPSYMAPEQAVGNRADCGASVDVYALGAILYELLSGRAAFKAATVLETIQLVAGQAPPSLRQFQPGLPRDLETICLKCLAKTPRQRYESALALAEDLRRFLHGEPIHARPANGVERAWRWSRRHPAAAAALTAVAAGVVCAVILAAALARANWRLAGSIDDLRTANVGEAQQRQLADSRREQAERAGERERDARRQVERVLQTLVDSFRSPDPARDGRTITVVEILDRAVDQLAGDADQQPEQTAQLWNAIGKTYVTLGLPMRALEVLEPCLEHCERHLGAEHPQTLTARNHLAVALKAAGQLNQSIQQHQQTLDDLVAIVGPTHPDTLGSINNLADAYQAAGLLQTAARLHEQVLTAARATLGADDPRTISSITNLAWVYDRLGRTAEAIEMHCAALEAVLVQQSDDHPQVLAIKNNLALAFYSAGQLDESAQLLEEVLVAARARLGDDHPHTLSAMQSLVRVWRDLGRFDQAEELLTHVIQKRREKLGPDHPDTLNSLAALAEVFISTDRIDEAVALHEQVFAARRARLSAADPQTLMSMDGLGNAYWRRGQLDEAASLLSRCLELRKQTGADAWERWATETLWGCVLSQQGETDAAERHLLAAHAGLSRLAAPLPAAARHREMARSQLVNLYERTGRTELAEQWRDSD